MKTIWIYLETAVLASLIAFGAFELWRADLKVPMYYSVGGDVHYHAALAKTMAETGWYTENPRLGAPGRMMTYDFPYAETGTFLGLKLFIALVRDPFLALNLFYLSTYVLTAWAAVFVLRRFEVHDQVAVAMGLLFAFTPYHVWKGPHHIHLSAYAHIPFAVMIALWLARGDALWTVRDEGGKLRPRWVAGRSLPALAGCLLISLGGPYGAYFGAFLILIGGVVGFLRSPSIERTLDAGLALVLVVALFAVQLLPFVIGVRRQGGSVEAWNRSAGFYYEYALWSSNLIRPTIGHRVPALAGLSAAGRTIGPADLPKLLVETKESVLTTPLGLVGSAGVFFLVIVALASPSPLTRRLPTLGDLGKLTVATLLLCLAGGVGEIVALFITPKIRCYGRLSIDLSFFAYLGIGLMMADHLRRRGRGRVGRGFLAFLAAATTLALLDQIPSGAIPDYPKDAASFRSDHRFVERVEESVPEGAMIFQLPPNSFPEFGMHVQMYDYNHFRGYFHSDELRWSYGAIRGRADEKLHSSLAPLPPGPLVDRLVELGFAGIYFNRRGHAEAGRDVIRGLLEKIPQAPIASDDGELLFFKLPPAPSGRKEDKH